MRRLIVLLVISVICYPSLHGQTNRYGVPLHGTYNLEPTGAAEYNHCMTKDRNGIVYFGNDGRGVLRYDGANWTLIDLEKQATLYAIASDENNIIYVGGNYEFGYLNPASNGSLKYTSLSRRLDSIADIGRILSIVIEDGRVIFSSARGIFLYSLPEDTVRFIDTPSLGYRNLFRMVKAGDRIFISENVSGLLELRNDSLFPVPGGEYYARKICTAILPFGDNRLLIGTYTEGLSVFDYSAGSVNDSFIDAGLNNRLQSAQLYTGTLIGSDYFAVGTLDREGVLVFDRNGDLVYQFTSDNVNIDNNVITALYSDPENLSELWVCTPGFATKIYLNLPFTSFSKFQGVRSGVNAITKAGETVYISHDNGVLKLVTGVSGYASFIDLAGISDPTYPLKTFNNGRDEFVIAGTQKGAFVIDRNDRVYSLEENLDRGEKAPRDTRRIVQSALNPNIVYLGVSRALFVVKYAGNYKWERISEVRRFEGIVDQIYEDRNGSVWVSTDVSNSVYRLTFTEGVEDTLITEYNSQNGLPSRTGIKIRQFGDTLYAITPEGVFRFNSDNNGFTPSNELFDGFTAGHEVTFIQVDSDGDFWLSSKTSRFFETYAPARSKRSDFIYLPFYALPNVPTYDMQEIDGKIWMAKSKNVFVTDKEKLKRPDPIVKVFINRITIGADSLFLDQSFTSTDRYGRLYPVYTSEGLAPVEFPFRSNDISFSWTSNYYIDEEKTLYSYFLEGNDEDFSRWDNLLYKDFSNLGYGHYKFRLKARTLTGIESEEAVFEFEILKPWYATFLAIILYIIATVGIILVIIKAYTKRLINENLRLEGIVAERTAEVVKQKEELESSIHYASRIQRALLPSEKILSENLRNYFVLFKPRDIVSGDFYWMTKRSERLFIVAADCTGHGVPGAFMSLLGMSFLDEIVNKSSIQRADLILKSLRIHVTNSLKQMGEEDETKDGMDMALLVIDFRESKIEFSGAYNPCFKIRRMTGEETKSFESDGGSSDEGMMSNGRYILETVAASKMPIGISGKMNKDFILHEWKLEKGVSYYLFSDGYVDQFGSNGKKFMKRNFKKLLLDIQEFPMKKQKEILEETLKQWMGDTPQIDDILVLGLRTD
ncbi:MAG: SpoIIE family protein phosphatase [Bacteroidales bacterium]|jgi:serine phosphatase RsbU (regulator of sigma subunit)/ligand-binding sensor domain-containing protein|nr:SpoIIE family protein phosphatase [Bacteroidales bacterium]